MAGYMNAVNYLLLLPLNAYNAADWRNSPAGDSCVHTVVCTTYTELPRSACPFLGPNHGSNDWHGQVAQDAAGYIHNLILRMPVFCVLKNMWA